LSLSGDAGAGGEPLGRVGKNDWGGDFENCPEQTLAGKPHRKKDSTGELLEEQNERGLESCRRRGRKAP